MCTVIVRVDESLTLLGVRDEFTGRPWAGPGEHWPAHPGVLGGIDLQAGGTWLAVDPATRRVGALLNGTGVLAEESTKVSRGDLPLRAVAAGGLPDVDLTRYDPFHLVLAELPGARMWSWDGVRLSATELPEGTSVIVNSGLDPDSPKASELRPLFAASGDWRALRPSSLYIRHELPDGRVYASLSASLLTLAPEGVGYEFSDLTRWNAVEIPHVDRGVS